MAQIHIQYFAQLKDQSQKSEEILEINSPKTAGQLYQELSDKYGFTLSKEDIRVAVNDRFADMGIELRDDTKVVFIPPVSGG